jgi:MFS family permease
MTQTAQSISIPRSIWALGFVSFLMKISAVIVFSLSPLFVTQVLGASPFVVGLMEGFVEAISLFTRFFAGILSDFIHKRKSLIVVGYVFALISRPLLALATSIGGVFLGRAFDRLGNGLDATPRDALVGDLAPPTIKGACYGLRESLSRAGSLFGSVCAWGLLILTANNYSLVFWLGSIPTALALLVLILFVKDPVSEKFQQKKVKKKLKWEDVTTLPLAFWVIILLSGFFMISNFSGAFLILRADQVGPGHSSLVMIVQNLATALVAYPVGYLSDKMGRRSMMLAGIIIVIFSNLLLAAGGSLFIVLAGVLLWGIELGITQSILPVLIADTCPQDLRGTGFGLFQLISGICLIVANALAGWLWTDFNPEYMFYTSASIAAFSSVFLLFIRHKPK